MTILRGVTIHDNVIVGACSLVNHSLESSYVYAGVPARKICSIEQWATKFMKDLPRYDRNFFEKNKKDAILSFVDEFSKR